MRLLVDEHGMAWDAGLGDHHARPSATPTTRCCPRRSRRWPLPLFERLLPRHLEIIYEINRRFLDEVRARFPGDDGARRAAVADRRGRRAPVRMAHLAMRRQPRGQRRRRAALASCCKRDVLRGLRTSCGPRSSRNMTNGVTPRRFMALANPRLSRADHRARSATAGSRDLDAAARLEPLRRRRGVPRARGARSSAPTRSALGRA